MSELKLIAMDAEDLSVLSTHLQDAVLRIADIAYLPREKRFAAIANRFDWLTAGDGKAGGGTYARRRAAMRFERVLSAQLQGIDLANKSAVLALLAISFDSAEVPEGHVTLHFAEGAAIRLHVECIEAELKDLGPVWQAKSKPQHPDEDPAKA
jgi:Protein of unknown function (DUF2948)